MELLQSQAPAERELLGSSVVRTLEFGNGTLDLRIWTLDIRLRANSGMYVFHTFSCRVDARSNPLGDPL